MKRRARITLTAVALGVVLLAVLVAVFWNSVSDHLEAWHFQLTRDTEVILPGPALEPGDMLSERMRHHDDSRPFHILVRPGVCLRLASSTGTPVIVDRQLTRYLGIEWEPHLMESPDDLRRLSITNESELLLFLLRREGYRVFDQRFPRRAYVVMGASEPSERVAPPLQQPILWDGLDRPEPVEEPYLEPQQGLERP